MSRICLHLFYFSWLFLPLQVFADFSDTTLTVWANEAIVATYTFNDQNFLARQKEIAQYFNANGWINYSKALIDSKLPETVKKNAYAVSAVALMPPIIKSVTNNQWQAVMPLLVVYKNAQYQQKQTLEITLFFTTAPAGQGVRGLAINSLQAKVVTPPCQCKT